MCHHKSPFEEKRYGSAREHGAAHERDHQRWSRRQFLRRAGLAGSMSMLLGRIPLTAMASSPFAAALNGSDSDRILVLIRFKGGNDGLNMIVPVFDYGTYHSMRPGIAIPENELIALNDAFGMPGSMAPLEGMWQEGAMKVVHSVGYPEQNLSHFRSSDIWASASDAGEVVDSGWLGRYLDSQFPDFQESPPATPPAVQIGGAGNLAFTNDSGIDMGLLVNNPNQLAEIAKNGALYDAQDLPDCYYGEQLGFLRTVANSTFRYADVIARAYDAGKNAVEYDGTLGEQFALIARLIKGGLGTRLFMVTHDGFDTHARQKEIHPVLLRQLATAVSAFYQDLAAGGQAHRVLAMTHSEFGRRPQQNSSGGTDHGAAAPLLLFGPGLEGNGFTGSPPDLQNLDAAGNLRYGTDFRQVYATLLEGWLCIDGSTVDAAMGQAFERLPSLGLNCALTSVSPPVSRPLRHWAYSNGRRIDIHFILRENTRVAVHLANILGQRLASTPTTALPPGEHKVSLVPPPGAATQLLVYQIEAGRQRASGKVLMR